MLGAVPLARVGEFAAAGLCSGVRSITAAGAATVCAEVVECHKQVGTVRGPAVAALAVLAIVAGVSVVPVAVVVLDVGVAVGVGFGWGSVVSGVPGVDGGAGQGGQGVGA